MKLKTLFYLRVVLCALIFIDTVHTLQVLTRYAVYEQQTFCPYYSGELLSSQVHIFLLLNWFCFGVNGCDTASINTILNTGYLRGRREGQAGRSNHNFSRPLSRRLV